VFSVYWGKIAKTVEAQKEVFMCDFGNLDASDDTMVDLVLFSQIWKIWACSSLLW
jgi:hypothetical protein